ncbi:MAG: MerR family transcriptional regulator [Burkholderiaceae bacterium]
MQPENRVSKKELARYFSVDVRTISNWQVKGLLPQPKRVGGRFFWSVKEIEKFWEKLGNTRNPC